MESEFSAFSYFFAKYSSFAIKNNNKKYSLLKFICFDASEYPYQVVLKFVYQIESPDTIHKIDELKYTAVSDIFYEVSGIAYSRLSTEQAERVREILNITVSSN